MKWFSSLFLLLLGCQQQQPSIELEPLWITDGFSNPESIVKAPTGDFYFVSNVAGEGTEKNGAGFISRLSLDGQLLEAQWLTGLNAPKGLAILDDQLFVSDIDRLLQVDLATAQVTAEFAIDGAEFLNDVAALADGTILVSDSGTERVFSLHEGRVDTWLVDDRLGGVNGLLPVADELLITTMSPGYLLAVDIDSRSIRQIAKGLKSADGIVLNGSGYLVSLWPGQLRQVSKDGSLAMLLDTREAGIFLNDIARYDDVLLVPNWEPSTVRAYRIIERTE